MLNKKNLSPPKHPFHGRLKSAGITQLAAAHLIEVSHQKLAKHLTSYFPMPADIERKLEKLLEKHGSENGGAL